MSDAQISAALDPEGHIVPIEAAERRANYYRCPECGDYLTVRKGDIRKPHFAHAPGTMQKHDCRLGTESGVREMQEEHRKADTEKSEQQRQIRVFLSEVYGSTLRLTGVIPALNWKDLDDPASIDSELDATTVSSKGTTEKPQASWFHPTEPQVEVELDPSAKQYVTQVDSGGRFDTIDGNWQADGLAAGDVFVGQPTHAERHGADSDPLVREGEWVFIIVENTQDEVTDRVETYQIGSWNVVGFEVDEDTRSLLREYAGIEKTDQYGFNADILLPPGADPRSEAPIFGQSEEEAFVAVAPPEESDPTFEVVSVPSSGKEPAELERTGPGQPRFFRPRFPEQGSRRLSIHWTNRHRLIHLHAQDAGTEPARNWGDEPVLGVRIEMDNETEFLHPIRGPNSITVRPSTQDRSVAEILLFEGPDGYTVEIEGKFPEDADFPQTLRQVEVRFDEAQRLIHTWEQEECDLVTISFDAAGQVEIELEDKKPWEKERTKEEVKEQLREMDELPNKARWPLVREVCDAPPGTRHSEFPGGTKKTVRRAFMEVREERKDE
jgi:hypothetical protein